MNTQQIITLVISVVGGFSGFVLWLTNWLKSLIKSEIAAYDKQLKDEKIHELVEENKRLKEWADKSKA